MSEISDRMWEIDREKNSTISKAMERHDLENKKPDDDTGHPGDPGHQPSGGGHWGIWMFVLTVLMAVTVAAVFLFTGSTITKMHEVRNAGDQMAVLLEDHIDDFNRLKDHVDAMEGEFRRAFQKDRADMAGINNALVQRLSDMQTGMDAMELRLREEILKYKSQVVDSQAVKAQLDRDYQQLKKDYDTLKEQFDGIQIKVLEMTVN